MPTSKELRAERASIWEENKKLLEAAEARTEGERDLKPEEQTEWERRMEAMGQFSSGDIPATGLAARIERMEQAEEEERTRVASDISTTVDPGELQPGTPEAEAREYTDAFAAYVRRGLDNLSPEQRSTLQTGFRAAEGVETRDMSVGTTTAGGFLVPQGFYRQIVAAQKAYGGMRQAAFVFQTDTGATLPVPTDNDTGNVGELLAENTQAAAQDLVVGQKNLSAYMYSSKVVKASLQLIQDSAFPIDAWLARKLGIRIGRIQNTHFTTGTGTGQPQGVVTGATLGKTGLTGQTLSVIYDDLVDLIHSVDPAYQSRAPIGGTDDQAFGPRALFMFNDTTHAAMMKIKDTQGRPLWAPGLGGFAAAGPDTVLGYPYVVNQDVAVMAANAKSILFGDFSNYWIREVTGITLLQLRERYADFLQVGFLAFQRADGALINAGTNPIKYYANSAT